MTPLKTVVIKLSGSALGWTHGRSINPYAFEAIADQIARLTSLGWHVGIVTGGGNIHRGSDDWGLRGLDQELSDRLGIDATAFNARALSHQLLQTTGLAPAIIAKPRVTCAAATCWDDYDFTARHDPVVIVAGGTGRTKVSSDAAAPMLARDMGATRIIMSKDGVNGLYTADPNAGPYAHGSEPQLIDRIDLVTAREKQLRAMDDVAMKRCNEEGITIRLVGAQEQDSVATAVLEDSGGTLLIPTAGQRIFTLATNRMTASLSREELAS